MIELRLKSKDSIKADFAGEGFRILATHLGSYIGDLSGGAVTVRLAPEELDQLIAELTKLRANH